MNRKNCPWTHLQHVSTSMVTQIIQSGRKHTHTPSRIWPGWYIKAYSLMYRTHLFRHRQYLAPPLKYQVFFHRQLWTLPFLSWFLRNIPFISWTWWSYCMPPHCSEIIRWAFMIYEHNSIPVTDTIKGSRINFQKTNFNQNKKIVDH